MARSEGVVRVAGLAGLGLLVSVFLVTTRAAASLAAAEPVASETSGAQPAPPATPAAAPPPVTTGTEVVPAPAPANPENAAAPPTWDAKAFDYERPKTLVVEETTPSAEQAGLFPRPPEAKADAPPPKATGPAAPRVAGAFNVVHLRFCDATGDIVPALLCTPKDKQGLFPLVIAVHGLTSHKGQVCWQVGPALAAKGFAVLALDLPCHGERPGTPISIFDGHQPFGNLRKAVIDVRQCIDLAEGRPEIDHKTGITLVGYSLGSWISGVAGAADARVKAMVLMVGGTFDAQANAQRNPQAGSMSVRLAIPHFGGRPLLLLNGKADFLVNPESSKRLFAAAAEPKKQIWYDSGHLLPAEAYADAAEWIDKTIRDSGAEHKP